MNNTLVFLVILLISGAGVALGGYFYLRPEKVVLNRIREDHKQSARKDPEFRKWLDAEIETQVGKTRRLGLTILIFEAILMVLVIGMLQKSLVQ